MTTRVVTKEIREEITIIKAIREDREAQAGASLITLEPAQVAATQAALTEAEIWKTILKTNNKIKLKN
jgi:hypothetical protein